MLNFFSNDEEVCQLSPLNTCTHACTHAHTHTHIHKIVGDVFNIYLMYLTSLQSFNLIG